MLLACTEVCLLGRLCHTASSTTLPCAVPSTCFPSLLREAWAALSIIALWDAAGTELGTNRPEAERRSQPPVPAPWPAPVPMSEQQDHAKRCAKGSQGNGTFFLKRKSVPRLFPSKMGSTSLIEQWAMPGRSHLPAAQAAPPEGQGSRKPLGTFLSLMQRKISSAGSCLCAPGSGNTLPFHTPLHLPTFSFCPSPQLHPHHHSTVRIKTSEKPTPSQGISWAQREALCFLLPGISWAPTPQGQPHSSSWWELGLFPLCARHQLGPHLRSSVPIPPACIERSLPSPCPSESPALFSFWLCYLTKTPEPQQEPISSRNLALGSLRRITPGCRN